MPIVRLGLSYKVVWFFCFWLQETAFRRTRPILCDHSPVGWIFVAKPALCADMAMSKAILFGTGREVGG